MSDSFVKMYDLTNEQYDLLEKDDIALLQFGFKLMQQAFFGEMTTREREGAWEIRAAERGEILEYRRQAEIAAHQKKQEEAFDAALEDGTED
jgi:hypothetical protein